MHFTLILRKVIQRLSRYKLKPYGSPGYSTNQLDKITINYFFQKTCIEKNWVQKNPKKYKVFLAKGIIEISSILCYDIIYDSIEAVHT